MESGKTILKNKSRIAMDEESVKDIVTIKYAGAATEKLIYKTWFCLPASNNPIYLIVLSYQLTLVY